VADVRYAEAVATGAEVVVTGCPFCRSMLGSATAAQDEARCRCATWRCCWPTASTRVQARLDAAAPRSMPPLGAAARPAPPRRRAAGAAPADPRRQVRTISSPPEPPRR
jgi:hypothetical protein